MADNTGIEWTDATWNPLRGCSRVSAGCANCYAEHVAARFSGPGQPYEGLARWTEKREAVWTGRVVLVPKMLDQPARWQRPRRIFVNSMSDLFHETVPVEWITQICDAMAAAPLLGPLDLRKWLRTSRVVEKYTRTFARVSALVGGVNQLPEDLQDLPLGLPPSIVWVVAGGESGADARAMAPAWARDLRDQCQAAGVPFLFKQWGEWAEKRGPIPKGTRWGSIGDQGVLSEDFTPFADEEIVVRLGKGKAGRELDGRLWDEYPKGMVV